MGERGSRDEAQRFDYGWRNMLLPTDKLVRCRFKPSQPQRIISGLKETFIKRYICLVGRTNKAEIRPEEQSAKGESCRENFWNEIQLKGPQRQEQTQEHNVKEWTSSVGLCHRHKP